MRSLLILIVLTLAPVQVARAHDIPAGLTVHAFVRPSGERLQLIVRTPLRAVRDIDFPLREGGYLDIETLAPRMPAAALAQIADTAELYEDGVRLPRPVVVDTQISLESDKSFASFDAALTRVTGPKLLSSARVSWEHVFFDVVFEYPIRSERSDFSIRPGFEHLGTQVVTVIRYVLLDGVTRTYEFQDDPGLIHLDPRWYQAAGTFIRLGFFHILDGIDHLLFLACLVIPFRRFRPLIVVVTAFTVAHSITLIASAMNFAPDALWFPPLIETLIATSIVYMALENIVRGSAVSKRWMIAFGFGLVHGFGFSFALRESLQLAGTHLLSSLLAFNFGVELGQVLVLAALVPCMELLFRKVVAERMGTILLSALVAHTGWHWTIERFDHLRQIPIARPEFDALFLAGLLRWFMVLVLLAAAVWLARMRLAAKKAAAAKASSAA